MNNTFYINKTTFRDYHILVLISEFRVGMTSQEVGSPLVSSFAMLK